MQVKNLMIFLFFYFNISWMRKTTLRHRVLFMQFLLSLISSHSFFLNSKLFFLIICQNWMEVRHKNEHRFTRVENPGWREWYVFSKNYVYGGPWCCKKINSKGYTLIVFYYIFINTFLKIFLRGTVLNPLLCAAIKTKKIIKCARDQFQWQMALSYKKKKKDLKKQERKIGLHNQKFNKRILRTIKQRLIFIASNSKKSSFWDTKKYLRSKVDSNYFRYENLNNWHCMRKYFSTLWKITVELLMEER